jgi:hypothetical protein
MAKKSKRARKKSRRKVSQPAATKPTIGQSPPVAAAAPAATADSAADGREYAFVVADLRQVAILATAMFALLIGLSFFIG